MHKTIFKLAVIPLCFIVLVLLLKPISVSIDNARSVKGMDRVVLGIPSFGFDTLLADILWISAIQYLGGIQRINKEEGATIYRLFDRITDLDPQFTEAYKLGGLTLGVVESEKAISLLEKGINNNKDIHWSVPYYASISAFFHLKNYEEAIRFLKIAVKSPEHPPHLDRLLAAANNLAGYKETALDMWQDIYKKSTHNYEKNLAYKNLTSLCEEIKKTSADKSLKDKAASALNSLRANN
jgi:tetratricopeptide (TPR) repeat protein